MEVIGRHALLFDDDSAATFVNSQEALVEWNSLLIDRYDVRHLLHAPPPLLKRRRQTPTDESEIDHERYLDLQPPESDDLLSLQQELNSGEGQGAGGTYSAVGFSYGNSDVSAGQRNSDSVVGDYGFRPPFPVPENLFQSLPPTEKLHQIMARTAVFVSKHGGQSEIVLRVKQGDNPTFGFLMPDHQLHAYFRFLVDHPEILKSEVDSKPQDEDKKTEQNHIADVSGGALSLLGSVYESGEEDDDDSLQDADKSNEDKSADSSIVRGSTHYHVSERAEDSPNLSGKDVGANEHPVPSVKETALSSKKNRSLSLVPGGKKMDGGAPGSSSTTLEKLVTAKIKPVIVDPPSDMKRTMDKLIEFIVKNGKEFEAVLIEQDAKNGRFPFLLPSNLYHPYYLNILQEAQESKQSGKISSNHQKIDSSAQDGGKKAALSKKNDVGSLNHDLPYDSEKKEKFKMVISGRKKDVQDPPPKPAQEQLEVTIDAEAAAAILQVATRGVRNPRLNMFPKKSLDDSSSALSGDVEPNSSFGSFSFSSRARSSTPNPVSDARRPSTSLPVDLPRSQSGRSGEKTTFVSVAKAIAKTAAVAAAAAAEADSSEACLTKEQKQKAERLKRAKMFAAMIKGGAAPRLSAEPPDSVNSGLQGSGTKASSFDGPSRSVDSADILSKEELVSREREGSSIPADADAVGDIDKFKRYDRSDDYKEKQLRKKHHYRSRRLDEDDKDDDDEREHKHSRKKHRSSRHSSHHDRDEHGHRKRHSSSRDRESRHRQKHHSSSEDEHRHRKRSHRHRRESHSERKGDYEEGEISNGDSAKRDAYTDLLDDRVEKSSPLVVNAQPSETTEIPNDLRAKVRAMLLSIQ